ncbi:MAG TPA: FKBP-type peptidyl-prolyl cis-trans isomerase, partial [Mariniphaga sp.]|nr:FKBP-type peptidyl-prolyl cis-trans isomerase [Mariniphaga sp.]
MQKLTIQLITIPSVILFLLLVSCDKENIEQRTFETEQAELDNKLKQLENQKFNIDTITNGLYYIIRKPGEGANLQEGDECTISYRAFLLNGTKIEDSYEIFPSGGKWTFKYKPEHAVEGLLTGLAFMNKGADYEFYIASDFAYGSEGANNVPPFSTIIYQVKMEEIKYDVEEQASS